MQKTLVRFSLLTAALAMVLPAAAQAGETQARYISGATEAADFHGDSKGIERFNSNEGNARVKRVHGDITAVSATSITVKTPAAVDEEAADKKDNNSAVEPATSYTFAIDSNTRVIRRFNGQSSVSELSVGDEVKVWATKLTDGTAKLIKDKSIWWLRLGGKAVDVNDTAGTFRLLLPLRKSGRLRTFSGEIRTSAATQYYQADGTAATFTDIDNNDKVRVRGVWNNVGYYLNARKVWLAE